MVEKKTQAWYALRRTMPMWSFEENLAEAVKVLPNYGIDELILKLDVEDFFHGQPDINWVKAYLPNIHKVKAAMDELGIVFSLNPWFTLGHCDRGRDSRGHIPNLELMVGHDGVECKTCACPLGHNWRENLRMVWSLYAEAKPHIMWIEDDIRTFNHSPVRYGCFCDDHIKLFSQRIGKDVSREELVEAVLAEGEPHPWREIWLDLQGEVMVDTARFIAEVVHAVSPETSLGLMSSGPRAHCLEGRRWDDFCDALSGGKTLYSRPPLGNYHENSLRGLYYSHDSIKITRYVMPEEAVEQTEVENVHFTNYANSNNFTFLKMAISFAYGSSAVTMNLFDHMGTPMENDPGVGRMLAEKKPFLEGLAKIAQNSGKIRGVQLLHHPRSSYHKKLKSGDNYNALAEDGYQNMEMLESVGIATTYENESVKAVSGQTLRAFTDEQIKDFLSGSILIDGECAAVLFERGFGKEIGLKTLADSVEIENCPLGPVGAEEFHNAKFGGKDKCFMTALMPSLGVFARIYPSEIDKDADEICRVVDVAHNKLATSMYAYENSLGGKVICQMWELKSTYGPHYRGPVRMQLLQNCVEWLSDGQPKVLAKTDAFPLVMRKDLNDGRILLGLFNLSLDSWEGAKFDLSDIESVKCVKKLNLSGIWDEVHFQLNETSGKKELAVNCLIDFKTPLFLQLER